MINKYHSEQLQYIDRYIERLEREVKGLKRKNERLNNIINNFEKWLEEQLMYFNENNKEGGFSTNVEDLEMVIEKLQELKGDSSNV